MDNDILVSNYNTYLGKLTKYFGTESTDKLIEYLGGEEKVMKGAFYNMANSGLAYEGSLINAVFVLIKTAMEINKLVPEEKRPSVESIVKVGLLQHISKVLLFSPNENEWEIKNRGIYFKYNQLKGALRTGERSTYIATNCGIQFTEEEFEAMSSIDKVSNDDNYTKYYSSALSTIIKQANELVILKYSQQ